MVNVAIGRFQPLHNGHADLLRAMLNHGDTTAVIFVGSSNVAPSPKNPFSAEERVKVVQSFVDEVCPPRVTATVLPLPDYRMDISWSAHIRRAVSQLCKDGLVTFWCSKKDQPAYEQLVSAYRDIRIGSARVKVHTPKSELSATHIRQLVFTGYLSEARKLTPQQSHGMLRGLLNSQLVEEFEYYENYKKAWSAAPYPPTFVTADAFCYRDDKFLAVVRARSPGKGLYALPGGFVNQDERVEAAALRELKEETGLSACIWGNTAVFDDPNRSLRGRVISHVVPCRPRLNSALPVAADDAAEAVWLPFSFADKNSHMFFEDHAMIVQTMIAHGDEE